MRPPKVGDSAPWTLGICSWNLSFLRIVVYLRFFQFVAKTLGMRVWKNTGPLEVACWKSSKLSWTKELPVSISPPSPCPKCGRICLR